MAYAPGRLLETQNERADLDETTLGASASRPARRAVSPWTLLAADLGMSVS